MPDPTPLAAILRDVERSVFPPADMGRTLVPAASARFGAVLGFTAHIVIAADMSPCWLDEHLPAGDPGAAFNPPFLGALERDLSGRISNIDMLMLGTPLPGPPAADLVEIADRTHPRVRRAERYRDDVRVYARDGGVLVTGRGLAGRWEAAIEVAPEQRGRGVGRDLAEAARHLIPGPVWVQVAPGNAASVRAFLAAGYVPVGQEALLVLG